MSDNAPQNTNTAADVQAIYSQYGQSSISAGSRQGIVYFNPDTFR